MRTLQILTVWAYITFTALAISTNNVCTFRTDGKLFTLTYLQTPTPYRIIDQDKIIYFNFCFAFVPPQCPNEPSAFSFVVTQIPNADSSNSTYKCQRYSSNSTTSLFTPKYEKEDERSLLTLELATQMASSPNVKRTQIRIWCSQRKDFFVADFEIEQQQRTLQITGQSFHGCPVLEISSFWRVFQDHPIFFGIVMVVLGFYLLFYGRSAVDITVFIAVLLISIAALGSLLTIFISPNSSNLVIYSSFLLLLFISCLLGYLATKLIKVSVFFIGAFFGFIIGILVSSMFSKFFNVYAQWPIILFVLLFSIPCGLLTFKYHDDIIIASSAFTGAYLLIRPFSWILGGFPNEFLLYKAVESSQVQTLPGTFFLYLLAMIVLSIVGSMYQRLKLHRENPEHQIEINIIQKSIEAPIDAVKVHVDKLIEKFRQPKPDDRYENLAQGKEFKEIK